ncbi:hypothetical protein EVAR_503_1 [Eumeta japonica]|uniref:Uncharacterized protein n=1 Tax=Eumeta variegata TaxID=151549 RepID=A0A4C1SAS4_EUMVA|nr:hypothetical protein EVAR_503_1 [Eumeta japonica]
MSIKLPSKISQGDNADHAVTHVRSTDVLCQFTFIHLLQTLTPRRYLEIAFTRISSDNCREECLPRKPIDNVYLQIPSGFPSILVGDLIRVICIYVVRRCIKLAYVINRNEAVQGEASFEDEGYTITRCALYAKTSGERARNARLVFQISLVVSRVAAGGPQMLGAESFKELNNNSRLPESRPNCRGDVPSAEIFSPAELLPSQWCRGGAGRGCPRWRSSRHSFGVRQQFEPRLTEAGSSRAARPRGARPTKAKVSAAARAAPP